MMLSWTGDCSFLYTPPNFWERQETSHFSGDCHAEWWQGMVVTVLATSVGCQVL